MDNPRYPHSCKVYRLSNVTNFSDGEIEVLYEGQCRKEGSTNLRSFKTNNVSKADYRAAIPLIGDCPIRVGDYIDITDYGGTYQKCSILDVYATNFGTSLYFNLPKT